MTQDSNQEAKPSAVNRCRPTLSFASVLLASVVLVLCCGTASADNGSYRIEVLIFSHIDSNAEALQVDEIRPFSKFPTLEDPVIREAPARLDVMSDVMESAWRRLRLSATFRPLVFAAWEQSRTDYHPPVRLHDEEMLAEQLYFPHQLAYVDLQAPDMFSEYRTPFYRLDGTVQLQRTRFLHLNLDLEYRQELLRRPIAETVIIESPVGIDPVVDDRVVNDGAIEHMGFESLLSDDEFFREMLEPEPLPGPALVHILKQSRSVRTGQMQYFDTPFLGVLVRVTATAGQ